MQTYSVSFNTDTEHASFNIEAATPDLALAAAHDVLKHSCDQLWFQAYEWKPNVNEIIVGDDDGNELAIWRDDDLRLRLAASSLLDAARSVIANWETGDLAQAIRHLAAAIAYAEGAAHE